MEPSIVRISVARPPVARLVLTAAPGRFIGLARKWSEQVAGVRTLVPVSLLGPLFVVIDSVLLFAVGGVLVIVLGGVFSVRELFENNAGLAPTTSILLVVTYGVGVLTALRSICGRDRCRRLVAPARPQMGVPCRRWRPLAFGSSVCLGVRRHRIRHVTDAPARSGETHRCRDRTYDPATGDSLARRHGRGNRYRQLRYRLRVREPWRRCHRFSDDLAASMVVAGTMLDNAC